MILQDRERINQPGRPSSLFNQWSRRFGFLRIDVIRYLSVNRLPFSLRRSLHFRANMPPPALRPTGLVWGRNGLSD